MLYVGCNCMHIAISEKTKMELKLTVRVYKLSHFAVPIFFLGVDSNIEECRPMYFKATWSSHLLVCLVSAIIRLCVSKRSSRM